jgi:hypothetical protein
MIYVLIFLAGALCCFAVLALIGWRDAKTKDPAVAAETSSRIRVGGSLTVTGPDGADR